MNCKIRCNRKPLADRDGRLDWWQEERAQRLADFVSLPPKPFRLIEPQYEKAIVLPWLSTGEKWEELKFTLRSINEFWTDKECPIILIGDRAPKWLKPGGRVIHVKIDQYKQSNEAGLWEAWQQGVQIAKEVAWWNDDIYLLKPVGWDTLRVALTEGDLEPLELQHRASPNTWAQALGAACAELRLRGFSPVMRFATHTPYLFEIEKSREIFCSYYLHHKGSWVTLYHNHHQTPHKPCAPYKSNRLPALPSALYLNHLDAGPDESTKVALTKRFSTPASWEK